ncbi:MAG: hypothetical protein RJA09_2452 [Pseudomonadota bacterium]
MKRLMGWGRVVALGAWCVGAWGVAQAALPIERWVHDNGAQVYWVRSEALPMVDVQVDVDGGSRRDPAAQAGLAAATASLLTKGVQVPGGGMEDENALAEAWADLGAQWSVQASSDRLSFRLRSLTQGDLLPRAVALAARQLAHPAFPEPVWVRERERLVAAWQDAQTRPDTLAGRTFAQAVYGTHPYGRSAQPSTWAAIDTAAMQGFYRRHARLCDARVTVVGRVERQQVNTLVGTLLAGWAGHGCAPLPTVPEVPPLAQAQDTRLPFQAAQAQILVGQPGIPRADPDFLALTLANHILGGGGFTSRLMRELREQRGLTYGVYSYFSPGRHAGAFTVSLQTRPDQAQEATALVHSVLRRMVAEGPTSEELREAKASLVNGFPLRLDSNRKLLDNVAALAWNGLPLDYLDTWTTQVQAIPADRVRQALQRVLQPDRLVTVVVGGAP